MSKNSQKQYVLIIFVLAIAVIRLVFEINPLKTVLNEIFSPIKNSLSSLAFDYQPVEYSNEIPVNDYQPDTGELQIISKNIQGIRKFIEIQKPDQKEVKIGMPVIHNDYLIGKVESINSSSLDVMLISDPNFRVTAKAETRGVHGIIKTVSGSVIFSLVPADNVEKQMLSTDGVDGFMPPGIPIGIVDTNISSTDDVFNSFSLQLPFNPSNIEKVDLYTP